MPPEHSERLRLLERNGCGHKPGREDDQERAMSVNLGLAIGDMNVARVHEIAREAGIEQYLWRSCFVTRNSAFLSHHDTVVRHKR